MTWTDAGRFAAVASAVAFSAALASVYWVSWQSPAVGLYHDDGVYLVTAKALAEGKGYRLISLPSEIPQTKYPFLFPAVLAIAMKISPRFPENTGLLKAVPLVCSLLWFVLLWKLLIRLGARKTPALWIVLMTAASPLTIFLSTNLMSEPLFALLCTASLLVATAVEDAASAWLAYVAGALAGFAFLTRSIGISILAAPVIAFVIQRHMGAALRFGLAGGSIGCLWPIWTRMHPAAADPTQLYYSAVNYASWNIVFAHPWTEKVRVFGMNLVLALASPATLLELHPPGVWTWIAFAILIVFVVRFGRISSTYLFVLLYTMLVLCWAWPPVRFLQLVLPFSLFFAWKVVDATLPVRPAKLVLSLAASLLSANLLYIAISRIPATRREGSFPVTGNVDSWPDILSVSNWIRENTKTTDVLLANLDPVVYLFSGRKAIRDSVPDSYKLFYSPDAPDADALGSLDRIIAMTHAAYLIVMPDRGFAESPLIRNNVGSYMRKYPDRLQRVIRPGANSEYAIYRILDQSW
ncbi:MAG: ArnT family glycosyltransferase [Bryobacteraceae bacterium]